MAQDRSVSHRRVALVYGSQTDRHSYRCCICRGVSHFDVVLLLFLLLSQEKEREDHRETEDQRNQTEPFPCESTTREKGKKNHGGCFSSYYCLECLEGFD